MYGIRYPYMNPYYQYIINFSIYESNLSIYETKVEIYKLVITLYDTNSSIYCTKVAIHGINGTRCPDMKPNYQYINSFLQYMKPVYQCIGLKLDSM
jgi:hypothetical protein